MSRWPYTRDVVREGEWRCSACNVINEDNAARCWQCQCDQDGEPPPYDPEVIED
jgi:hypothetical protein